jgi:hypothetical protein
MENNLFFHLSFLDMRILGAIVRQRGARIWWVSKKLPEQDIDKDYFQLKSPLSFIGIILKKTIGL